MTSSSVLTREALERLRDKTFRRIPRLRVRGERSALSFITEVGFCSTFHRVREPLPCLWVAVCGRRNPRFPKHTHTDPYVGLTWLLKDLLPAKKRVYYGKLLKGRPTLVSLDCFPAFFRLIRGDTGSGDFLGDYKAGRMTRTAKLVMEVLQEKRPQYTPELRSACRLKAPEQTREFERAMGELQRGLWIVKTEERYEPSFSYRWDLLDHWLEEQVVEARKLDRAEAVYRLVRKHLEAVHYSRTDLIAGLFTLPISEVAAGLDRVISERRGVPDHAVKGLHGRWVVGRHI
ncbi:MAG TPA: crosslink repair DNA glycosylase YcaQ family protein [Candidatus Methylomirabilis sp.]|nr:crosslink repair DNA glycosylase YcaQ family protein [Candidatus Methylomirabilis sp.]